MTITMNTISASPAQQGFPLSPVQRALLCRRPDDAVTRRACTHVRLRGAIDHDRLERAILDVIARHEVLRTRIVLVDGLDEPLQIIEPVPARALVSESPAIQGAPRSSARAEEQHGGAPFLARIQRLDPESHRLELSLPWLLADARTLELLIAEIARSYQRPSVLDGGARDVQDKEDEPLQFADVAAWHEDLFESPEADVGRQYWRNLRLDDSSFAPVRLSDEARRSGSAAHGCLAPRPLALATAKLLDERAAGLDVDPAAVLHAALLAALTRVHGKPVAVAVAAPGRDEAEVADALGVFERWLPVALDVDTSATFSDLVRDLRGRRDEALQWQDAFDGSDLPGNTRAPLCAGFSWRAPVAAAFARHGFVMENTHATEAACQLVLEAMPGPDGLMLRWSFDAGHHTEIGRAHV